MTTAVQTQVKAPPVQILSGTHSNLLQRQCACGGTPGLSGECEECRKKKLIGAGGFQAKLAVSQPGDPWEQEADRMAESVVRGVHSNTKPSPGSGQVMKQSASHPNIGGEVPSAVHEAIRAPGRPLDPAVRKFMEDRFAYDFSQVRIHDDRQSAESARQVNALAYTVGRDVVFNAGQYAPGNPGGQRLLAHELTHVVQQTVDSTAPTVARQQAPQTPPGQEEAQQRAQWYPSFPGCGPWQRRRVDYQLTRARSHVRDAIDALREELRPSPSGIITIAGSALEGQFHTHRPEHIRTIITRMQAIESALERGPRNIRCSTRAECNRECGDGSTADACAGPSAPIRLCPSHFEGGDYQGTMNIIHEAGHQSGRGMVGGTSHIYRHDARFANLTTAQAMNNPDAYALFVRDLHYGGPLASARPAGAPPEAPHEREARAQSEGTVWAPRDMDLSPGFTVPHIPGNIGWFDGRLITVPAAFRRIGNQLRGTLNFTPDAVGRERHRPYPPMAVSARIVLIRSSGRPARSVLLDVSDNAAADAGAGTPVRTRFNRDYDFHFSAADRGTLQIEMRLQDFDTATTLVYHDTLLVQP
jgi:uncharacterized protein DUF4157